MSHRGAISAWDWIGLEFWKCMELIMIREVDKSMGTWFPFCRVGLFCRFWGFNLTSFVGLIKSWINLPTSVEMDGDGTWAGFTMDARWSKGHKTGADGSTSETGCTSSLQENWEIKSSEAWIFGIVWIILRWQKKEVKCWMGWNMGAGVRKPSETLALPNLAVWKTHSHTWQPEKSFRTTQILFMHFSSMNYHAFFMGTWQAIYGLVLFTVLLRHPKVVEPLYHLQ